MTDGETRAVGEPDPPAGLLQNCLFGQFSSRPSTMTLSITMHSWGSQDKLIPTDYGSGYDLIFHSVLS